MDDRARLELRICELVQKGWTLEAVAGQPGFPCRRTVGRWRRESPMFAEALRNARSWWRGQVGWARAAPCFDPARAEVFLAHVRGGEAIAALLRRPEFPNRRILNRWKAERPDFAEALARAAASASRFHLNRPRPFDGAAADRIICRLSAGARMREALAEPGLPGAHVVRGWRSALPEFDHAVAMALKAGHRRRMAGRRALSPELADEICRRIELGATLDALGEQADMPHRVTLQRWLRKDAGFAARVRAACALRDEPLADEVLEVAAEATAETLDTARARVAAIRRTLGARSVKRRRG